MFKYIKKVLKKITFIKHLHNIWKLHRLGLVKNPNDYSTIKNDWEILNRNNKFLFYALNKNFLFANTKNLKIIEKTLSQLGQEIFVLCHLDFKQKGFFVEFGACDGLKCSNTYLLETEFNWDGILSEPAKTWHEDLKKNRNVNIDYNCVWKKTGDELTFNEVDARVLSTIKDYSDCDNHTLARQKGKFYSVCTISLEDLLIKHKAPKNIDYLSIDTEGSEYEILKNFNFKKYKFSVITCEHNFTPAREKIYKLLTSNGYKRILKELSKFDDWYILEK